MTTMLTFTPDPRLSFDAETHTYRFEWDDEAGGVVELPSVTMILDAVVPAPHLQRWYGRLGTEEAERRKEASAAHGTDMHRLLADLARAKPGEVVPLWPAIEPWAEPLLRWLGRTYAEVIAVEQPVHIAAEGFAGSFDLLGITRDDATHVPPGVLLVTDLKTSARDEHSTGARYPYRSWRWQLAAYAEAISLQLHDLPERFVLHAPSDQPGTLYGYPLRADTQHRDYRRFRACLRFYEMLREKN